MAALSRPRGTNDVLPDGSPRWEWLLDAHRQIASAHGYDLVETPIFEATEMFERGTGAGTDVVEKEMFTFADRGGRSLTLRPEGTPGVLRAVLGAHLEQERRPVRVRYAGPMFRYAKPQAGRYHEFWQVGIEAIAERSPALDAEVIEVAWRFLATLGLTGTSLQLNSLGDIDDRRRYRLALLEYYTPLRDQLCADCRRRLEINPLRLLDCKRDAGLVAAAPAINDSLSQPSLDFFAEVRAQLDAAGIAFSLNPRLVRGLDYYAHTTFEFWHESLQGAQNALGGGGRYDGLAEVLGLAPTPGIGYALGVERILIVCAEQGLGPAASPPAVLVLGFGTAGSEAAAARARELRNAGLHAVLDVSDRRLDRKLRSAERQGFRLVVIIGDDEAERGEATWRDLATRHQETVPSGLLAGHVRGVVNGAAADS